MKKAVIYTRVSTDAQADNYSLESQAESCQQWAKDHGYQIVAQSSDDHTGTTLDRPGLQEVLSILEAGGIDALIVHSADRLSRNLAQRALIREELETLGIELIYATRGKLVLDSAGRFIDNIEGAVAEYEVSLISERMMRGKKQKVKMGRPIGGGPSPFGYKYKDNNLVIYEPEAEIVRLIFEMYLNNNTIPAICRKLEALGAKSKGDYEPVVRKKRTGWSRIMVYNVLKNDTYSGIHRAFKWSKGANFRKDGIPIEVPAIVSKEIFQAAQDKMIKGKSSGWQRSSQDCILAGLIKCEYGFSVGVTRTKREDKTWSYYACYGRQSSNNTTHVCNTPIIPVKKLDEAVWQYIVERLTDLELLEKELLASVDEQEEERQMVHNRIAWIDERIKEIDTSISRLVDLYALGSLDHSILAHKTQAFSRNKQELILEKEQLLQAENIDTPIQLFPALQRISDEVCNKYLDPPEKHKVLEDLEVVIVIGKEIELYSLVGNTRISI